MGNARKLVTIIAFMLALARVSDPVAAENSRPPNSQTTHHSHGVHEATAPTDGELWPTDEPLRTGMSHIEAAVEQARTSKRLGRAYSEELARAVQANVTYIVEHCKLPPAPDAALHELIVRMMSASGKLKDDASRDTGLSELDSAVQDYHRSFDHSDAPKPHLH